MDLEQRVKLARLIVALADDDRDKVVSAYKGMGVVTKNMGEILHTSSVKPSLSNRTIKHTLF